MRNVDAEDLAVEAEGEVLRALGQGGLLGT